MFLNNGSFNQPLTNWNTNKIDAIRGMFEGASNFNQPLNHFNTTLVTNMEKIFTNAQSFNKDISSWDVSSVTNMNSIFNNANALDDENKCSIHTAFESNSYWPYDWSGLCDDVQTTYVPDDNFEQALIELGYDDVVDNYVLTENINSVTELDVEDKGISDLTGIEWFASLITINCSYNNLSAIDVSSNQALAEINARNNQISSIDVSNNPLLTHITLHNNEISSIDVSNNSLLVALGIAYNNLTSINVDNNPELEVLHFLGNDVVNLNISSNSALELLNAMGNNLFSIDLSNNTALTDLYIGGNDLTSLDVGNNSLLTAFTCENNNIDSLDVSNIQNSWKFDFQNNQMVYLNMRNGNTSSSYFKATGNSLTCIETLDPVSATENWTNIDEGATFSIICGTEEQDSLWHVATTGSDASGDGSQDNPLATIQIGINAASDGNRVLVAAGTYVEHISYSGKSISITGEDREITIIDADTSGRAFYFEGFDQNTIAFSGFTITNGESYHGAGIYINNSIGIDLFDLIVNENNATGSGAGGGIHIHDSMGELHNVHIENNEAYSGGGIYMGNSDIILDHVNVLNNNGRNRCGGTGFGSDQFDESTTEWTNSVFIGNTGLYQGSAMCMGDSVIISNLTITQNTTYNSALTGVGNWTIVNSIISDNLVSANVEADAEINFGTGTLNMSYTNLSGEINAFNLSEESELILGEGNIDLDPIFCDPDNGDFHLAENSPSAGSGLDGENMGSLDIGCDAIWIPPVLSVIADTSMDEDSQIDLILSAYSQDGYDIYFEVYSDTSSVYTDIYQDTLTISLMEDWYGASEITVVAYSEHGYDINDSTSFTVTVNPVDDLPYVDGHIFPLSYDEDFGVDTVAYLPDVFMDIDGELEFSYSFSETGILSAYISEGHLVLSSVPNANGLTELFVTASNPVRASITDTVQIEIFSVNDAPTVSFREVLMYEDSVHYLTPLSEFIGDADNDDLFLDIIYISEPMNEFIDIHFYGTDTMAIVSYGDWNGSGQIEVLVSDGQEQVSGTFDLDIFPVNDNPMFHQMQALVSVWDGFEVYLHLSDVDMDSLIVSFDEHAEYPSWLSIESNPYRLVGMAPEALDIQFPLLLTDGVVTVIDTFHLSAQHFNPRITSIDDIPSDQGGKVYVHFLPSFFDHSNGTGQMYTVFRRDVVDNVSQWVVVLSGGAIGDTQYTYEVPTLMDSTADHDGITSFKVVASMNEGNFHSQVGTGYSIDNIAPGVPTGMEAIAMDNSIFLNWDMSEAEDFQYFQLERSSTAAGLDTTVIIELIENTYEDFNIYPGTEYLYKLAAYDYAGNRSEFTEPVSAILLSVDPLSLVPEVFALHQNYPNPFNPTTQIRYDLPLDKYVTIIIYDVMGRKIKSLINAIQEAGYRSITWDATNDLGQPVSAGMYIYTIQAGEFRQTRKMVLLK